MMLEQECVSEFVLNQLPLVHAFKTFPYSSNILGGLICLPNMYQKMHTSNLIALQNNALPHRLYEYTIIKMFTPTLTLKGGVLEKV